LGIEYPNFTITSDIKNFPLHDFWFIMVRAFQNAGQTPLLMLTTNG
jgi:hypothetical protein